MTPARLAAWRALLKGGDAAAALDHELRAANLDPRDRALAAELAHGTLKRRRALEWAVQHFLRSPFAQLDPPLRWALLLGAYQLLYLDKIPAHSAVDESVALARMGGHAGTAAMANAVLRKLSQTKAYPPRPKPGDPPSAFALHASLPDWLAEHFIERFGFEEAMRIADGINAPPRRAVRMSLGEAPAGGRQGAYGIPECVILEVGAAAGRNVVTQSEESQLAVHLLDPKPGEVILDVCAGRGIKTGMIAARLAGHGTVYALDDDSSKLKRAAATIAGAPPASIVTIETDARGPFPQAVPQDADAVLIDAPCSGIGIVGRRADLRWRKRATDPARFATVQNAILEAIAPRVKPGGRLLYVTCSTHQTEDEDVVRAFLDKNRQWRAADLHEWAGRAPAAKAVGPFLLTVPGVAGNDGFFYALLEKRGA